MEGELILHLKTCIFKHQLVVFLRLIGFLDEKTFIYKFTSTSSV